ncbi:MAG: hypothetical protein EPO55_12965 [Reyranella sp.]|nr:MAG: hypothetical protein EPO55_12965 [Reyranella sp.]
MVHLVVGQQPLGIDVLEISQPRVDDFHADEGIAHGAKRLVAADRRAASCDVGRDVKGDFHLHADHVHRLAVEPGRRWNQCTSQKWRRIGFGRRRARAHLPAGDRTGRTSHFVLDGVDRRAVWQGERRRHLDALTAGFQERPRRV